MCELMFYESAIPYWIVPHSRKLRFDPFKAISAQHYKYHNPLLLNKVTTIIRSIRK